MATSEVSKQVRLQQMFIGGEWCGAADGRTYVKTNPYTGEVVSQVAAAKRADARRAVEAAAAAFPAWRETPPGVKRQLFLKAAELLESRQMEIASLMTEETGGTFGWGMFNCFLWPGCCAKQRHRRTV